MIRYGHHFKFCFLTPKTKLSIFFVWLYMIISSSHTVKPLSNKLDIVAVSFHFLMHIEWPHGNVYLFFYLQIGDLYYNTDFMDVRIQPVKIVKIILFLMELLTEIIEWIQEIDEKTSHFNNPREKSINIKI